MIKKITSFLLFLMFAGVYAQSDADLVLETVNVNTIKGHIGFLADDALKGRETGTPENKIAALYLAQTLQSYGVTPALDNGSYFQEVKLERTTPPQDVQMLVNGSLISDYAVLQAKKFSSKGEAVYLNYGLEADYQGKNVKGLVVVIKAGSETANDARAAFGLRAQKVALAKANGADAIIELLQAEDQMWGFIEHNFNDPSVGIASGEAEDEEMPYIWALDKNGDLATAYANTRALKVEMKMGDMQREPIVSYNVVGMIPGTDPKLKEEFIIYSGHYDHVGIGTPDATGDTIYNGARDNAVGTTTVLSMAENLAKYPTKRSALFILFTGEEKGLLGSRYYTENPVLPLNKMVYCFNSDNAGYNDTSLATIIGLPRTTAAQHIKDACEQFGLTAVDDPAPEQGLFDRSDNVNFAAKGIPAPTFSLGFTAFNGTVTEYYHRPGDEVESLDFEYLTKFFKAYVMAGRLIGNDPVTPKWTAGDKYEAASKELYKN